MSKVRLRIVHLTTLILIAGCSGVDFENAPSQVCSDLNRAYGQNSCKLNPDGSRDFDYSVYTGEVDILFVDDNSGSMYTEQEKMANQFPGFLDSLANFSYQIAITTTDVNGTAPGQDGRFLNFASGQTILKNSSRVKDSVHDQNINRFQTTIKRSETLQCPNNHGCPSGDERGIYALNRAMARSENTAFFRPGGHLAIVVLSDEDERSSGGGASGSEVNGGAISDKYKAENLDLPETFVRQTKVHLPADKSVSVHSIIIRPAIAGYAADTTCWQSQNAQGNGVKGYYGTQYAMLSFPTSALKSLGNLATGTMGSICSANYTQEMGNIAEHIKDETLQLPCTPDKSTLKVSFAPSPAQQTKFNVDSSNRLVFEPALAAGTKVHLKFRCPS